MGRYVDLDKVTVWRCPRNIAQMREWAFGLPVEDVKPVVHAQWMPEDASEYNITRDKVIEKVTVRCSRCYMGGFPLGSPYCPNCGAKMDEEEIVGKRLIHGFLEAVGDNVKSVGKKFADNEEVE